MQFFNKPLLLLSSLLSRAIVSANPITPKSVVEVGCLPFNFTKLFTATLKLGAPSNFIPIPGGVLINEPILSGKVAGPAINGTIKGGFAHPPIYKGTLQVPIIDLYRASDDGMDFYIHETGIGSNVAQVTRIVSCQADLSTATLIAGY
jgi:hypothetical protein